MIPPQRKSISPLQATSAHSARVRQDLAVQAHELSHERAIKVEELIHVRTHQAIQAAREKRDQVNQVVREKRERGMRIANIRSEQTLLAQSMVASRTREQRLDSALVGMGHSIPLLSSRGLPGGIIDPTADDAFILELLAAREARRSAALTRAKFVGSTGLPAKLPLEERSSRLGIQVGPSSGDELARFRRSLINRREADGIGIKGLGAGFMR